MSGGQIQTYGSGGIIRGEFVQNSNILFLAYLLKDSGDVLTSADVQGFVRVQVYQRSGETPETALIDDTTTYPATSAVTALSLTGWTRGSVGANFNLSFLSTRFTQQGGMDYRFKFTITLLTNSSITVIYDLFCRSAGA